MADESMDVDAFDADAVHGGGGYVDDDLDLDDDDDDEPLVMSGVRPTSLSSPSLSKSLKRRAKPSSPALLRPDAKKRRKEPSSASAPHPDDYQLRRAGTADLRDYVVAKFVTRMPDLIDSPHVRIFRENEPTVNARAKAIEAHRKQQIYFNSFSGKRRLERYEKQGIVSIPDRYRRGWALHVTPKHIVEERARLAEAKAAAGTSAQLPPTANGVVPESGVPPKSALPGDQPNGTQEPAQDPDVDVFEGTFDGKATSRYAIMVMTEGSKTIDVIPIDDYSWTSFRANRSQGVGDAEATETQMRKFTMKSQNRLSKFHTKLEDAQGQRDQSMGDTSRIKNSKDYVGVGIQRSRTKFEYENDDAEELDFEQEFDNDDVTLFDKETVQKTENRVVIGDAEQNEKDLQKLLKDEPVTARPASPGSESDEDPVQSQGSRPTSRSPSPSRPASASRSPTRSARSGSVVRSRQPTPLGTSPYGSTPLGITPSPGRSPGGNTPQMLDLSHCLPPSGTLPTIKHIKAVLSVLLQTRERILFKEFLQYFQTRTAEQKSNLTRLTKAVALVTAETVGNRKIVYISWKRPQLPAGPSGR